MAVGNLGLRVAVAGMVAGSELGVKEKTERDTAADELVDGTAVMTLFLGARAEAALEALLVNILVPAVDLVVVPVMLHAASHDPDCDGC